MKTEGWPSQIGGKLGFFDAPSGVEALSQSVALEREEEDMLSVHAVEVHIARHASRC